MAPTRPSSPNGSLGLVFGQAGFSPDRHWARLAEHPYSVVWHRPGQIRPWLARRLGIEPCTLDPRDAFKRDIGPRPATHKGSFRLICPMGIELRFLATRVGMHFIAYYHAPERIARKLSPKEEGEPGTILLGHKVSSWATLLEIIAPLPSYGWELRGKIAKLPESIKDIALEDLPIHFRHSKHTACCVDLSPWGLALKIFASDEKEPWGKVSLLNARLVSAVLDGNTPPQTSYLSVEPKLETHRIIELSRRSYRLANSLTGLMTALDGAKVWFKRKQGIFMQAYRESFEETQRRMTYDSRD